MATKNLARTVIEVGRTSRSKYDRKQLRKRERREATHFCKEAEGLARFGPVDYEPDGTEIPALDSLSSGPVPLAGWISQDDKLGPAMRWMESRCGQKWDDVFSELSTKFRSRGIALSHVVDTHMLEWVDDGTKPKYGWRQSINWYEFIVDEDGILRKNMECSRWKGRKRRYNSDFYTWVVLMQQRLEVKEWAGEKKIIQRGDHMYWAHSVHTCSDRCPECAENRKAPPLMDTASVWTVRWYWLRERKFCQNARYRQGVEFSAEDYDIYEDLDPRLKKELVYKKF